LHLVQDRHVDGCADVMILAHHVGIRKFCIDLLKELRVLFGFVECERPIAVYHDALEVLASHHRAASQPAEMAIGIDVDTCHGGSVLASLSNAQNAPVARTPEHTAQHLTGGIEVPAPEVMDLFHLKMA